MANVSLQQFFDLAQAMRNDATQRPSGDKTTFQLGEGGLVAHQWKLYTQRGRVYNETNQKLRQDLYDALTAKLGPLEKLDADTKKLLKLDDFQAKNGKVTSDRPLTLRRIEAIRSVVEGRVQAPAEQPPVEEPQVEERPQPVALKEQAPADEPPARDVEPKRGRRPEFTDELKAANDRANGPDAKAPEKLPPENRTGEPEKTDSNFEDFILNTLETCDTKGDKKFEEMRENAHSFAENRGADKPDLNDYYRAVVGYDGGSPRDMANFFVKHLVQKKLGKETGSYLHTTLVYGFKEGGRDYSTTIMPRQQLLANHGCKTADTTEPLNNLFTTTLKEGDKTLVTLNRFGSTGTTNENRASRCRDLAIQTFLANPKLVEAAKNGQTTFELPIYRVDMEVSQYGDDQDPADRKDGYEVALTFRPEGADKDITVTLNTVEHTTYCALDSYYESGKGAYGQPNGKPATALSEAQVASTLKAIESLASEKDGLLADPKADDATKTDVKMLWAAIQEEKAVLLDNGGRYKDDFKCSKDMLRLGSAVALLAAKLGHVPAVNCNMGRDRTGIMTTEVQMLALRLENGEGLGPVDSTRNQNLRSRLIVRTGSNDTARVTNLTPYHIQVKQSEDCPKDLFIRPLQSFLDDSNRDYALPVVDEAGEAREIDDEEAVAREAEIDRFADGLAKRKDDFLALCRRLFPGKIPETGLPFKEDDRDALAQYATRLITNQVRQNRVLQPIVRQEPDPVLAAEQLLAALPEEVSKGIGSRLFEKTCELLKDSAVDELEAALTEVVKDAVEDASNLTVYKGDFRSACRDLKISKDDTPETVKAKVGALKNADIATRRAVLVEIRDAEALKNDPELRTALLVQALDEPGLKPGELEEALALAKGLNLKAGKGGDEAVKVLADTAKAVAGKSDAFAAIVAIALVRNRATELKALVRQLGDNARYQFSVGSADSDLLSSQIEEGDALDKATRFMEVIASRLGYDPDENA